MAQLKTVSPDVKELLAKAWQQADVSNAPLNQRIVQYVEATRKLRPELIAAYDRFVAELEAIGSGAACPNIGDEMPEFLLPNQDGQLVGLSSLLKRGPLIVSFNRGHWCPYCRLELRTLARKQPDFFAAGAKTVSIVPEITEYSSTLRDTNDLPFEVLTDMDLEYSQGVGLAVLVSPEIKQFYLQGGINLPVFQGTERWVLPSPATLVVGQDGRIKARFVHPDFRRRMTIEDIKLGIESG